MTAACWQAINAVFAALIFNLLYDVVLSRNVEWHTLCPIIDIMNHKTGIRSDVQYQFFSDRMEAFCDQAFSQVSQGSVATRARHGRPVQSAFRWCRGSRCS